MKKSTKEALNNPSDLADKLWDEIAKTIADHMPNQLFPLFKEAFGKEYPKGTSTIYCILRLIFQYTILIVSIPKKFSFYLIY